MCTSTLYIRFRSPMHAPSLSTHSLSHLLESTQAKHRRDTFATTSRGACLLPLSVPGRVDTTMMRRTHLYEDTEHDEGGIGARLYAQGQAMARRKNEMRRAAIEKRMEEEMDGLTFTPTLVSRSTRGGVMSCSVSSTPMHTPAKTGSAMRLSFGERIAMASSGRSATPSPSSSSRTHRDGRTPRAGPSPVASSLSSRNRQRHEKLENRTPGLLRAREARLEHCRRALREHEDATLTFTPSINASNRQARTEDGEDVGERIAARTFFERLDDWFFMQKLRAAQEQQQNQGEDEHSDVTDDAVRGSARDVHLGESRPLQRRRHHPAVTRSDDGSDVHERLSQHREKHHRNDKRNGNAATESGKSALVLSQAEVLQIVDTLHNKYEEQMLDTSRLRREEEQRALRLTDVGRRMTSSSKAIFRRRLRKEFLTAVADALDGQDECLEYLHDGSLGIGAVVRTLRTLGFLLPLGTTDRRLSRHRDERAAVVKLIETLGHGDDDEEPRVRVDVLFAVVSHARMNTYALRGYDEDEDWDSDDDDVGNGDEESTTTTSSSTEMGDIAEQLGRLFLSHTTYVHTQSSLRKSKRPAAATDFDDVKSEENQRQQRATTTSAVVPASASPRPRRLKYAEMPYGHAEDVLFRQRQLRRRCAREAMKECTFKPKMIARKFTPSRVMPTSPRANVREGNSTIPTSSRDDRVARKASSGTASGVDSVNKKKRENSRHGRDTPVTPPSPKGLNDHVLRMRQAIERSQLKKEALAPRRPISARF